MEELRKQFETWIEEDQGFHGIDLEWHQTRNCYAQYGIHLAWRAWKASRQAVEIKMMPDINPLMFNEDVLFGYHKAKTEDEDSIRAAGLRIKGE